MFKVNIFLMLSIISIIFTFSSCNYQDKTPVSQTNTTSTGVSLETNGVKNTSYSGIDMTGLGLKVPDNFTLSLFADKLSGARDIVGPDTFGNFYVSRTSQGIITQLEVKDGKVINTINILRNLNNPHGLAIDQENGITLYFAETKKLSKIELYSDAMPTKILDLPAGGRHYTRSLLFGTDNKLYISLGSTCDTCYEKDNRIAAIYRVNKDGTTFEQVASGLRNSVFMNTNPITGDIWATEMGRDFLGDNVPPDEINIIKMGGNYGWPLCYGKNIHDSTFDTRVYIQNPCFDKTPSHIDLQAHSAPLGFSFIPEEGWPEGFGNDLLISYHGSWNRSEKTGYKIVYIDLDDTGNELSKKDFITGWLDSESDVSGRPVDILSLPGGTAYISDDRKGVIYKLTYNAPTK